MRSVRSAAPLPALAALLGCSLDVNTGPQRETLLAVGEAVFSVPAGNTVSPLAVGVIGRDGKGKPNVTVTWAIEKGGGTLSAAATTTDSTGLTSVTYVTGTQVGTAVVTATVANIGSVGFSTFVTEARPATSASILSGNNQSAAAGKAPAAALTVRVLDAGGVSIPGVPVTWAIAAGGGSLSAATSYTSSGGTASTRYTAGTTTGASKIAATVAGLPALTFTVNVTP